MTIPLHLGILAPDLNSQHGWGAYSFALLRGLREAGVHLTIVTAQDSPVVDDLRFTRLLPSVSAMRGAFLLRQAAALPQARALLHQCHLIHTLVEPYAPLGNWLKGQRPHVITLHGTYARLPSQAGVKGALYRRAFGRAALVCVSRHTQTVARAVLPNAQTRVINNGVNAAHYLELPRNPTAPPFILTVGAVKARKGARELVAALSAVRARVPNARLVVVGTLDYEPQYVAQLRADIAALGLSAAVDLIGRVDDEQLRQCYSEASVFALPARDDAGKFEGFGLVLMEASAAGLPVVGTWRSGTEDAVEDGVTGLLVTQGDNAALADALTRLLTEPALAARMGAAGRLKAAEQTWERVTEHYRSVYREILNHEGLKR